MDHDQQLAEELVTYFLGVNARLTNPARFGDGVTMVRNLMERARDPYRTELAKTKALIRVR